MGEREHDLGEAEVANIVWTCERHKLARDRREDVAFLECSSKYPVQRKIEEKPDGHKVISIITGPEYLQWPTKRRRLHAAAINLSTCIWVGGDPQAEFDQLFNRSVELHGSSLFTSSDAERHDEYEQIAKKRGSGLKARHVQDCDAYELGAHLWPSGYFGHFEAWEAQRHKLGCSDVELVCDIEHHPCYLGGGRDWPTLLTHGTIVGWPPGISSFRLATSLEHFGSLGLHVTDGVCKHVRPSVMRDSLLKCSRRQRKFLAGNSMHFASQSVFMIYVLANVVLKPPLQLPREPFFSEFIDDEY